MNVSKLELLSDFLQKIRESQREGLIDWQYNLAQLMGGYEYLMKRFCPFEVNETVCLKETPDFTRAPGWGSCKSWLVKNTRGIVKEATCEPDGFHFMIKFEKSSHLFHFREDELKKASFKEGDFVFMIGPPACAGMPVVRAALTRVMVISIKDELSLVELKDGTRVRILTSELIL